MGKAIFYLSFMALGIFWAEVISTNVPFALAIPPFYPAYGLLYVFFLDQIFSKRAGFPALYMMGFLVGLITETYVAKVAFFGLEPDAYRLFGFAPGAVVFVIMFYHAFYSFLIPLYFARRVWGMPLRFEVSKRLDIMMFAAPILLLPVQAQTVMKMGPVAYLGGFGISFLILILWTLALRRWGSANDVALTARGRVRAFVATVLCYVLFFIFATNYAHGHPIQDIGIAPLAIATIIIIVAWQLVRRAGGTDRGPVPYDSSAIDIRLFMGWIIWMVFIQTAGTCLSVIFNQGIQAFILPLGLFGVLIGVCSFLRSAYRLQRD